MDQPIFEGDIRFVDTGVINDQRIGDHSVDGSARAGDLGLAHTITYGLSAAEFDFFAVDRQVTLHLDDQIGICKAQAIARGGAIHSSILSAGDLDGHLQVSHNVAVKAKDTPRPTNGDQLHFAALPRLKPNGSAGGNVEPVSMGCRAIKCERGIGLGEMIVTANLHGAIARICHH